MTTPPLTLESLATLRESWDFEAKLAAGRDGRGALPDAMWATYSAMANTDGGVIMLGLRERPDHTFEVGGLADADKVEREMWSILGDRKKVSANLLTRERVQQHTIDGRVVLQIDVPRAARAQRPVHINDDLFGGTYLRVHEGDHHAEPERVRRMVADADDASRDDAIVEDYDVADLDATTVQRYRARFRGERPDHVWNDLDDKGFLTALGARRDARGCEPGGLTVAGLLMFGTSDVIRRRFQHYFLDYQERRTFDDLDWEHRIVPDGTWSGNLYDFYNRVTPLLLQNLKVPFALGPDLYRIEDTAAHKAVREAVVNALIHADYQGRASLLFVRTPAGFLLRNPGTLRVSLDQVRKGGLSDCRNRGVQQLFLMINLGEHAGSGWHRIARAWSDQHWAAPSLVEDVETDTVTLRLGTTGLVPAEAIDAIDARFHGRFRKLDESSRTAVLAAAGEGRVTNRRVQELTGAHPRDITLLLSRLVRSAFLVSGGEGSGRWYTLAGEQRGAIPVPVLADQSRHGGWVSRDANEARILAFCKDEFRTTREIAEAIGRAEKTVRSRYIPKLVASGALTRRFSGARSNDQAYKTVLRGQE